MYSLPHAQELSSALSKHTISSIPQPNDSEYEEQQSRVEGAIQSFFDKKVVALKEIVRSAETVAGQFNFNMTMEECSSYTERINSASVHNIKRRAKGGGEVKSAVHIPLEVYKCGGF